MVDVEIFNFDITRNANIVDGVRRLTMVKMADTLAVDVNLKDELSPCTIH